ncbi:cobalamin-5'-phosphate synthase [Arcicella aurantiaca]|uniref:Adenosylcobinamide-GDP ribazoletransferase n=1 Tax=Arcicella aurantiaca TaxID=591202 RepID=A0A316DIG4_9BACT|nr:adenosylcobinamide-GDP ribazoletransferase [Arcicella aurantiaca]PWK17302.1 cobalamin-5'-phosphate synthase [Arcicella aurantiaca]
MKNELRIFFTALMFYTRIPCPSNTDHSPDYINKATRYFPFIGWIVGGISFIVFALCSFLFEVEIAVVFSLIAGILCTGAFHEDGFADVFDGFGGGWTKIKILEIMKDSRIGAYGGIAIGFLLILKILVLIKLLAKIASNDYLTIFLIFVSYHALARLTAINIVFNSEYAREDETSKAKPIAKGHTSVEIVGAYTFGLIPLVILGFINPLLLMVILPLFLLYAYANRYFKKWLGGYTGDCLGATEQFGEIVVLLTYLVLWKYI